MVVNENVIACIGAGYVGGPTMAVIAYKCPHLKVIVVDINKDRIDRWNSDNLPVYEPGLDDIVREVRGKNLFFSTDIPSAIKEAGIIFVSVNTPTKEYGEGRGMAPDISNLENSSRQILQYAEGDKIVVEKSTVPVRAAEAIEKVLSTSKKYHFEVISNPEFLAEGSAIRDLLYPDRVLIGSKETPEGIEARNKLVSIYANWVPMEKIITSNIWSSELSKLASNAFLAQRISSINALSELCEKVGADIEEVSRNVGLDSRIGSKFLKASVGFGGSCFKKDILNLVYICKTYGLDEVADYWLKVVEINEHQKSRFIINMIREMSFTLANKRIALFGFAFKANTNDTRESPAITVAKGLLEEKAIVNIYDPKAIENAKNDLHNVKGSVNYFDDPYEAVKDADAIAVMTEWELFKELDYEKVFSLMRKPAYVFDGRNILDHKLLYSIGFNVYPIGKPPLTHFSRK
ncbi:MAG: nucleotide sugar dehydrogenase [Spirochaetes bacterium]|nr:nucleotide sugar dehydrogenase [Spirochaetota bacterium]